MGRALIGITTYGRDAHGRYGVPAEYVDSVRRAGGATMLLAPGEADLTDWLARLDGLVLTGGGDIDPGHYGGRGHEENYLVDAERDRTELELARVVLAAGLPTLAICRGAQLLNVCLGGTLVEHLERGAAGLAHRRPPREPLSHPVKVEASSRLASILGATEFEAASWHHQAIKDVAPTLSVVARAPDGTIEAVETSDHPWLVAVQWHPELTAASDVHQQRLFDALVVASGSSSRRRPWAQVTEDGDAPGG